MHSTATAHTTYSIRLEALLPLPTSSEYRDSRSNELLATWSNGDNKKPVLEFYTTDNFKMGEAQAHILGSQIQAVYKIQLEALKEQNHITSSSENLADRVKNLTVPDNFKRELEGIVSGLTENASVDSTNLTLDTLVAIHNCTHLNNFVNEEAHPLTKLFYTRKHKIACPRSGSPESIEMETYPGLIGVISASNNCKLSLRVKKFGLTISHEGIPATLYARQSLERCASTDELGWDIYGVANRKFMPSAAHILEASDPTEHCSYSFNGDGSYEISN